MRAILALTAVLVLTGCSAPSAPATQSSTVTVFAAASLTESFQEIADAFEREHPGIDVVLGFGGSSGLATQIVEGAPADVFASASRATMTIVTDARLTDGTPASFATNRLAIAVPAGNPGGITELADLAEPGATVAVCAREVPCGAAAATLFETAGITPSVDTYEQDVKAVLTKVELGEVDAGVVYATDVMDAGAAIEGIALDSAAVEYPIAALAGAANPREANAFVAFVLSDAGQRILEASGFGAP